MNKPIEPGLGQSVRTIQHFIGGEFVTARGGKSFENRSPVDGRLISMVSEAGKEEVDAAVKAAQAAAYAAVDKIDFASGFCRKDIGWREVARG